MKIGVNTIWDTLHVAAGHLIRNRIPSTVQRTTTIQSKNIYVCLVTTTPANRASAVFHYLTRQKPSLAASMRPALYTGRSENIKAVTVETYLAILVL